MDTLTQSLYPPLLVDYLREDERLLQRFSFAPTDAGCRQCANELSDGGLSSELCDCLLDQNEGAGASERALANIARLRQNGTLTVVTGQQAGVLGGPLYVTLKVLSAASQAARLERMLERPVVPIFWLETNDHDFEEIRRVRFLDDGNDVRTLAWVSEHPHRMCCGAVAVDESLRLLVETFFDGLRQTEFTPRLRRDVLACYEVDETLARASMKLAAHLFSPFGVVCLDPSDDRIRRLFRPLLERELHRDGPVVADTAGIVDVEPNRLGLFALVDGSRQALFRCPEGYCDRQGAPLYPEALPLLPTVLTRNLCQDYLLHTVASVLGPGELSYYSLLKPLYEYHRLTMPVALPRALCTVVGVNERRQLTKTGLSASDILSKSSEELVQELVHRHARVDLRSLATSTETESRALVERLRSRLAEVHTTAVEGALQRLGNQVEKGVARVLGKAASGEKARLDTTVERARRLSAALLPGGHLQERTFGVLQYMNSYGVTFLTGLLGHIEQSGPGHRLWEVV